jgi:hypothetical protein
MATRLAHLRLPRRLAAVALMGAVVPMLLTASPVAAANNVNILGVFGDCLFQGSFAGANKVVKIEWRDAENNLKSKHSVTANGSGDFVTKCELAETIETGDVLRTQIGTSVRSFTVPKVTATVDRDADTVSGKATTTDLDYLGVLVGTYNGGFGSTTDHFSFPAPIGTPIGTYVTATWDAAPDIKGWDDVAVIWNNLRGDSFLRYVTAEGMRVWSRQPFIQFAGNPGQLVSADLNTAPAGTLRANVQGRLNTVGLLSTGFTDSDGDTVRSAVGNQVDADFALDSDFVIPNIVITVNKSTDRVTVDCNITESGTTGVFVEVYSRDFSKDRTRLGFQNNSGGGTFLANFATSPTLNIVSGDKVDVYCKFATGDVVARTFTVL